ncbi:helix-turn-helix transcriptional regulator [Piscinibacter sp.]|uniref:helix-turn-helix transcriptional regulator n=1 Tax=Piscinibacter sp. TaxID=1903157 RepID=UPI002CA2729B|nr:AlpA family phage regulatory protein [Albitalea sp.]HUG26222.1 AlpA family phage regulatory protein [Albitalea sp.]
MNANNVNRADPAVQDSALIDMKAVLALTGFRTPAPVYERIKTGNFPQPIRLSKRCTRFRAREVKAWCEAQTSGVPG